MGQAQFTTLQDGTSPRNDVVLAFDIGLKVSLQITELVEKSGSIGFHREVGETYVEKGHVP